MLGIRSVGSVIVEPSDSKGKSDREKMKYIELSSNKIFVEEYVEAMGVYNDEEECEIRGAKGGRE